MVQKAIKERRSDLYLSVWLKANKEIYSASVFGFMIGEESQKPGSFGWVATTLQANTWFELKIPFGGSSSFGDSYGTYQGQLFTTSENIGGGLYLYECHWGQLAGAVIDVASVELRVADKTATAGMATNVAIPETIYGAYEITILDATGMDVTANCTVSGTNVTISTASTYTIVYKTTSNKFAEGVTVKAKLIVS